MFGDVLGEEILRMVNIMAELHIIDFSDVTTVKVLADKQLEERLGRRDEPQLFQNTAELLGGDVRASGLVVALELRLDENTFIRDLRADDL